MSDPFAVLGLGRDASIADVRAARRRLAFASHPDRGGDEQRMREVNLAFDAAIGHLTGRRPLGVDRPSAARPPAQPRRRRPARPPVGVQHDVASFVIEALPAVAFEALLVVSSWLGEVLVDEPPYALEVHLGEPLRCWCRLDLVPDAGSSTVSLTVSGVDGSAPPEIDDVRDTWVTELNRLGGELPLS